MATLVVPPFGLKSPTDFVLSARTLTDWLAEDWALLFSNPEDFGSEGIESDRWLSIMHDEFLDRGVRPLALGRSPLELDRGWVSEIIADDSLVTLDSRTPGSAADSLRHQLGSQCGRYVLIIDSQLEQRGILRYVRSIAEPLSPLDLLSSVDAMRHRSGSAYGWGNQRRSFIPC